MPKRKKLFLGRCSLSLRQSNTIFTKFKFENQVKRRWLREQYLCSHKLTQWLDFRQALPIILQYSPGSSAVVATIACFGNFKYIQVLLMEAGQVEPMLQKNFFSSNIALSPASGSHPFTIQNTMSDLPKIDWSVLQSCVLLHFENSFRGHSTCLLFL